MTSLVIAEHDNASIKGATLNTVTAAAACGGDVHVLVAGHNAAAAAQAAAQIAGVSKVIHADEAGLAHGLAENVTAHVLSVAANYSHIVFAATPSGKNSQSKNFCSSGTRSAMKKMLVAASTTSPQSSVFVLQLSNF
ncbi:MAG: Electron transfer flavoprotein subunit alpha, partial [Pseudomonadota bacterium]